MSKKLKDNFLPPTLIALKGVFTLGLYHQIT